MHLQFMLQLRPQSLNRGSLVGVQRTEKIFKLPVFCNKGEFDEHFNVALCVVGQNACGQESFRGIAASFHEDLLQWWHQLVFRWPECLYPS